MRRVSGDSERDKDAGYALLEAEGSWHISA